MCAILFCISSWHVSRCTFQIFPWNLIRRRQSSPSQTCWSSTIVLNAKDGVRAIKINDDQVLQKAPVLFKRESLFQQHGPVLSHDLGLGCFWEVFTCCFFLDVPKTWVDDIVCRKNWGNRSPHNSWFCCSFVFFSLSSSEFLCLQGIAWWSTSMIHLPSTLQSVSWQAVYHVS